MYQTTKRNFRLPDAAGYFPVIICMVALFNWGCYSKVEGCLDIAAENFDLNADRSCDDCCTYPSISLSLSQKWNDNNFSLNDTLFDIHNNPYKIADLDYILSSFFWTDHEGVQYTVDSTEILCGTNTIRYTPDIIQVEPQRFAYELDTIRVYPFMNALKFKLGWEPVLDCVDETSEEVPDLFSDDSPLWDSVANARAAIRLVVQRDITTESFDTVYIHTCQEIQIPYELEFILGLDTQLDLTVNYAQWFMHVDTANLGSFTTSIIQNIQGSFIPTP